jgi:hypothetical protein
MRSAFIMLALVSLGYCFDFSAIDTGNANWVPTGKSVADITVQLKSEVNGLFKREDSFSFRYDSPKIIRDSNGTITGHCGIGGMRTFPSFDACGNKGWIYIKEISEHGAQVRCVVRETPDNGKILYEREFLIPWTTKVYLFNSDSEHFDAKITIAKEDKT